MFRHACSRNVFTANISLIKTKRELTGTSYSPNIFTEQTVSSLLHWLKGTSDTNVEILREVCLSAYLLPDAHSSMKYVLSVVKFPPPKKRDETRHVERIFRLEVWMNSSPAGVFTVYLCQDAISEDSPNRYGQKTGGSKKLK